jgi:hypothetical protein
MDDYQQLWQLVQQVVPGADLEPATLQLELEQYRSKLLKLFHNKVCYIQPARLQQHQLLPLHPATQQQCIAKLLPAPLLLLIVYTR